MRALWIAIGGAFAVAGIFAGGYQYGHTRTAAAYEKQIAALKAGWQAKSDAAEKEAQEKYEDQNKKLSQALAQRDKALSNARAVRISAVWVRDAADTRAASDLQTARDSGDRDKERLARCESLLGEGAEVLTRVAADKDALVKAAK